MHKNLKTFFLHLSYFEKAYSPKLCQIQALLLDFYFGKHLCKNSLSNE